MLSGESRSTTQFFEGNIHDFMMSTNVRKTVLNNWGSIRMLLPKGGSKIWGDKPIVYIDNKSYGVESVIDKLLSKHFCKNNRNFYDDRRRINSNKSRNRSGHLDENVLEIPINYLFKNFTSLKNALKKCQIIFQSDNYKDKNTVEHKLLKGLFNRFVLRPVSLLQDINPLLTKLPYAPNMKIYSLYGHGNNTECAYMYQYVPKHIDHKFIKVNHEKPNKNKRVTHDMTSSEISGTYQNHSKTKNCNKEIYNKNNEYKKILRINRSFNHKNWINGVKMTEGDGTVPLISCGYMTYRGWKNSNLNPSNIKTITREYSHKTCLTHILNRGGPSTSEHADILGNYYVTEDIIRIVCGENLDDSISSNIKLYADIIDARVERKNVEDKECEDLLDKFLFENSNSTNTHQEVSI
ncbi:hypothetical protein EDEG_01780 [Edhazardia aedis USNM 41457]|uniref:Uncharacterized protein n=1 Tax=Edhazardia aedis (strain USNM 41457) TaxID=1003232 RepID=J9D8U0_EDHAE|nr:hypothetical protein EDEG_01780 [Edhazardia aedis USNM 41457]|eukprot:EJW03924.1 hypothetical protein EDEG_01780 [Edhazardia aedis USNM 41457]